MAQLLSHPVPSRPLRLVGLIALRAAISVLVLVLVMVLGEAWVPGLIDPVLLRLGI